MRAVTPKCRVGFHSSEEIIHSGKTHMLTRKSRATNSAKPRATNNAINHFELLTDFVFVLVLQRRLIAYSQMSCAFLVSNSSYAREIMPSMSHKL